MGEYSQETTIPEDEMTQYLESVIATLKSHRAEIENLITVCCPLREGVRGGEERGRGEGGERERERE